MMLQTKECEVIEFIVLVVMIKMSYLTNLYINISTETKTYAAATARKQNDLFLSVFGDGNSCHCKVSLLVIAHGSRPAGGVAEQHSPTIFAAPLRHLPLFTAHPLRDHSRGRDGWHKPTRRAPKSVVF
jgi:hypothetical protein